MADIFKRTEVDFGGAFTSEKGLIVPNKGLTGILMQNFQIQYSQNVTRIYEIGRSGQKTKVYLVGGRSQGTLSAGHIIGPGVAMQQFYDNFSDVCQANTNDIQIKLTSNICAGGETTSIGYKAKYCVLTSIGISVAAQDFVISESSQLMFSGMEYAS